MLRRDFAKVSGQPIHASENANHFHAPIRHLERSGFCGTLNRVGFTDHAIRRPRAGGSKFMRQGHSGSGAASVRIGKRAGVFAAAGLSAALAGAAFAQQSCDPDTDLAQQRGFDKYHGGCGKAAALRFRAAAGLPITDGQATHGYSSREAGSATDLLTVDLDTEVIPAAGTSPNTMRGSNT